MTSVRSSRPLRRTSTPRVVGVLVLALVASLMTVSRSSAQYNATAGTPSGSWTTAACYYRASVQSGTATSTADGITTVKIAAVDPSRSFLMFSTRHNLARPVAAELGGHIASATTLEFVQDTDEATQVTVTIERSVVEYACGVTVQRGSIVQTAATLDITISAVPSTAQAFVLWSKNPHMLDQTWDANDPVIGELTSTTNLEFRADALNVNHTIWWQVVAFTDAAMIDVQRGTTSLAVGATSVDVTLPTAVSSSRSFLLVGMRSPNGIDLASGMLRGRLTSSTTVTIDRSGTTVAVSEIGWQVVELFDGTSVQSATSAFATGSTVGNATLGTAVDLSHTNAFATTQTGGGQNGGRTTYTADDNLGVAAFALRLTSTTDMELRRDVSAVSGATANVAFSVVSWGLP